MNYLFTLLPAANISTEGLKPRVAGKLDRIEIYLTIMDMAGSISIFDNLYRNFDELKIFEKFYNIT